MGVADGSVFGSFLAACLSVSCFSASFYSVSCLSLKKALRGWALALMLHLDVFMANASRNQTKSEPLKEAKKEQGKNEERDAG
tara:strand:- start:539 stop:787 length:249 start_codon:yes stop_codon:yes gene_type:complete